MKVHEIMTGHARSVGPENTLVEAAGLMRELDVGALPVYENDKLVGIVTDRDLALRAIADGLDPNSTPVRAVMSQGVVHVYADQEVEDVVRLMEERQIRRVPVVSREERLVGIVSLGDIAISSNPAFSGMALRDVSEPTNPSARQRRLSEQSQPSEMATTAGAIRRGNADDTEARSDNAAQNRSRSATRRRSPGSKEAGRSAKTTTRQRKSSSSRSSAASKRKPASRAGSSRKTSAARRVNPNSRD